ncbi:hypothetical protein MP638_005945 [Amoeboaphelidium occidentale]|nr:hypothetical protein MP638_005945 [Amoeboaphelidium occidentale]
MRNYKEEGNFNWIKRMGVQEAYHRNPMNRLLHYFLVPIELMAVIALLMGIPYQPYFAWFSSVCSVVIGILTYVYASTDFLCGITFSLALFVAQPLVYVAINAVLLPGMLLGVLTFAFTYSLQAFVAHKVFEEEGRDDADVLFEEVLRTKNIIPLFLAYYYYWVDLFFALGYKPELYEKMKHFRDTYEFPKDIEQGKQ